MKDFVKKHRLWFIIGVGVLLVFLPDPLDLLTFGTPIADIIATALAVVIAK